MVDSDDVHVLELSHSVPRFLAVRGKRRDRPCSLFGEKGGPSACARRMERHMETTSFLILGLELSSQVQQRIEENLKRGLPAEAFARSTVEFGNEGCYLSLAEVLHINRLGTVFTD